MKLRNTSQTLSRRYETYTPESNSSARTASIHKEHISRSNDVSKDDNKDSIAVLIGQAKGGVLGKLTYEALSLPIKTSQQELAQNFVAWGCAPDNANSFASWLIEYISDPNVRNVIITISAGLVCFTIIYKTKWPLWLKITLILLVSAGVGYLLFTYFTNPTQQKPNQLPSQEKVNNKHPK
ncbi:MAG: hypothetical protein PX481_06345 [Microcystis sp. M53603_WE2]|jgi:hypothetical protein|uniref:Uncharacterized protein n=1 Tax=Microcystis aeruginosa PCC 9717 TaxID=1160286 RepID=I4FU92_MICAE|nr:MULTISPECIES: hypothetical protein [Microcystis]MCE2661933.1 hypothetical protein [Microcystis sp. 53602_E8]MCZ8363512.1 hypothetical protein [Microcystis sp. LE19-251.1A]MDJ0524517.1 hypothetical protein [Microcystis sp. M53600_WE12]MDJ0565912.1 hypothetical protein [Microcystis sp. M49629_WE12]MCZ8026686.1 hypothetical protein [Microcystis sp. LE19-10.1B]